MVLLPVSRTSAFPSNLQSDDPIQTSPPLSIKTLPVVNLDLLTCGSKISLPPLIIVTLAKRSVSVFSRIGLSIVTSWSVPGTYVKRCHKIWYARFWNINSKAIYLPGLYPKFEGLTKASALANHLDTPQWQSLSGTKPVSVDSSFWRLMNHCIDAFNFLWQREQWTYTCNSQVCFWCR